MMGLEMLLIYGCAAGAAVLIGMNVTPVVAERVHNHVRRQVNDSSRQLDQMFLNTSQQKLAGLYVGLPLGVGLTAWLVTRSVIAGFIALVLIGLTLPRLFVSLRRMRRLRAFNSQLVDALLLMNSSLKAGLSILQAIEVVVEEMPSPITEEFALVLKENKMGVPLDESLSTMRVRMQSDDLPLFVTAVLIARETGGDVTKVFTSLVETIRERRKIREKIITLTVMPRLQGWIMAALPFVFVAFASSTDAQFFPTFMRDPVGQFLLLLAILAWLVSLWLIAYFSKAPV